MLENAISIGGTTVRNRIVRSATAERAANPSGVPGSAIASMYRALACGGVGLIITGHMYVDSGGKAHQEMTGIHDDRLVEPLSALASAAHSGGARIAAQLNHGGRACDPAVVTFLKAPSAIPASEGSPVPSEMTMDEIAAVVESFARATKRAKEAGFDAVQIHCAHGYIGSQFLSPLSNMRKDEYGGALPNRARFVVEAVEAAKAAAGRDFPVLVKLGVSDNVDGGLTASEGVDVAEMIEAAGCDAIEVSTGGKGAIALRVTRPDREAYLLPLARAVRSRVKIPVILVGGMRSRLVMERVLAEGIDMISMSRPLIREPDLPNRLLSDPDAVAECVSCSRCWPKECGEGISCKTRKK